MKLGLLGDVHGDANWTNYALHRLHEQGVSTVVQLGDFGIWPGEEGARFIKRVRAALKQYDMTLYVVPGNHEDYDIIEQAQKSSPWFGSRIFLAPRGHRGEFDGVSYVMLGGAPSPDRAWRQARMKDRPGHKIWWEQEQLTREDVDRVKAGGHATLMFGHDAPFVAEIDMQIAGNPHGFFKADLDYCAEGRRLYSEAAKAVMPDLLFHGHYHFPVKSVKRWSSVGYGEKGTVSTQDIIGQTKVYGLSTGHSNHSFAILDTETLEVTQPVMQLAGYDHRYRQ